jgi:hypothetical protein
MWSDQQLTPRPAMRNREKALNRAQTKNRETGSDIIRKAPILGIFYPEKPKGTGLSTTNLERPKTNYALNSATCTPLR